MTLDIQFKINSNPNYQRFIRENPIWYKILNRNPLEFKNFVSEVKDKYELKIRCSVLPVDNKGKDFPPLFSSLNLYLRKLVIL